MKRLLIVDIDGVIADCSHRLHFQEEKDYNAFYSGDNMLKDSMIVQGRSLVRALATRDVIMCDYDLIILTGRPERTRLTTEAWLDLKSFFPHPDAILMRKDGDFSPSDIIKPQLLFEFLYDKYTEGMKKRELKKFQKMPQEELATALLEEYDECFYIDDGPKNVAAVCAVFPKITGMTFGTKRFIR